MAIFYERTKDGILRAYPREIESSEGLEKIAQFIERKYGAKIINKYDGIDARAWILQLNGKELIVVWDDLIANFFYSNDKGAEALIIEIAEALDAYLNEWNTL